MQAWEEWHKAPVPAADLYPGPVVAVPATTSATTPAGIASPVAQPSTAPPLPLPEGSSGQAMNPFFPVSGAVGANSAAGPRMAR